MWKGRGKAGSISQDLKTIASYNINQQLHLFPFSEAENEDEYEAAVALSLQM